MKLHAIKGDIVEVAPKLAEAAVLWLRSGFNRRHITWYFGILKRYGGLLTGGAVPWARKDDHVLTLESPDDKLRFLYVFSNSTDALACRDLDEVRTLVERSLDKLSELGVTQIAMIHIPVGSGGTTTKQYDELSAGAMIDALQAWDAQHPGLVSDVYLVDHEDGFANLVEEN